MNALTRRTFCALAGGLAAASAAPVAVMAAPLDPWAGAQTYIDIWREAGNTVRLTATSLAIVGLDALRIPAAERLALLDGFHVPDLLPYVIAILAAESGVMATSCKARSAPVRS